jgi:flagellar biosynthetic protein FliQ
VSPEDEEGVGDRQGWSADLGSVVLEGLVMDVDSAAEMIRQSLLTAAWICLPVVVVSLIVGLVIGTLQAATSIQEPTVNTVPRVVVTALTIVLVMPWGLQAMVEFTLRLWRAK